MGALDDEKLRARREGNGDRECATLRSWARGKHTRGRMDAKELNALVHDREAAFYDDRFLISYDGRIGGEVERDLRGLLRERPKAERALDVACGTGYLAIGLAASGIAHRVEACDLSAEMVLRARENSLKVGASVGLLRCDAERLPYADGAFDMVAARGALHHVPDPIAALREIRRVLEPGGTAIILAEPTAGGEAQVATVVGAAVRLVEGIKRVVRRAPDADEEERKQWELASMAANLHTFTPDQIIDYAERAGFDDITVRTASWAWILVLGLNYYLVGEWDWLARSPFMRAGGRLAAAAAAMFDRALSDRVFPPGWRHTIQAVLR
jgi:ubiquinone/menaquinone biosynthesis C-methylase UbiE